MLACSCKGMDTRVACSSQPWYERLHIWFIPYGLEVTTCRPRSPPHPVAESAPGPAKPPEPPPWLRAGRGSLLSRRPRHTLPPALCAEPCWQCPTPAASARVWHRDAQESEHVVKSLVVIYSTVIVLLAQSSSSSMSQPPIACSDCWETAVTQNKAQTGATCAQACCSSPQLTDIRCSSAKP